MDKITLVVTVDYDPRAHEVENHIAALNALATDLQHAAGRLARRHLAGGADVHAVCGVALGDYADGGSDDNTNS